MTPRDVVTRAVEFQNPQRLPINGFGEASDVAWIACEQGGPGSEPGAPADLSPEAAARAAAGAAEKLAQLETDPARRDKYVGAGLSGLLVDRLAAPGGTADLLADLASAASPTALLADKIVEYDLAVIRGLRGAAGARLQGLRLTDGWDAPAGEEGTDLDAAWQALVLPRYRRIFDAAHECGWHVWMNLRGETSEFIPGLIDAGCDVLARTASGQARTASGPAGAQEIGRRFAGRVTFEALCDARKDLPPGARREGPAEAERLLAWWGTPTGGFILSDGTHAAGESETDGQSILETFRRLDPFKMAKPAKRRS
jgi:hypothetical protein